jgi:Spy/CpxP family protein refolding chaperone
MKLATVAVVTAGAVLISMPMANAQNAQSGLSEMGTETGNWGLTPFSAVPTFTVRPEDRAAIRALEDQHIKERRAFEDRYEGELRRLIRKQAEEREALRARLVGPRSGSTP